MNRLIAFLYALTFLSPALAQDQPLSEHALKTFEIYKTIVEVDTSKAMGNTPKVAQYLADELIAAGFPPDDIEVLRLGDLAALVARYRGDGSAGKKPILFLGHMDVVEANAEDWARPELAEAEFALNSDAGGGDLDLNGKAITYNIQAAEKTYATWEITVRNPGEHSSRPREDNAIYDLAAAIKNIQGHRFPVQYSDMTRNYFKVTGEQLGGELGAAMLAFARDPSDAAAADRLARESSYVGTTRTTCVVTMLKAGHAENALPQSATATVNCRIFPGVPVSEIEATLRKVVANDAVEFRQSYEATESPISELREDVVDAVSEAVNGRYPEVQLLAYMESGGTDGMHFRRAGIPTWAVSGLIIHELAGR